MPHFNRQHEPTDINEAVVITQAQLNDLKQFLTDLHDRSAAPPIAAMSDAQFAELRGLLQPGFELSKLYLAQVRAAQGAPGSPVAMNLGGPLTDEPIEPFPAPPETPERRDPIQPGDAHDSKGKEMKRSLPVAPPPSTPVEPVDDSTDRD